MVDYNMPFTAAYKSFNNFWGYSNGITTPYYASAYCYAPYTSSYSDSDFLWQNYYTKKSNYFNNKVYSSQYYTSLLCPNYYTNTTLTYDALHYPSYRGRTNYYDIGQKYYNTDSYIPLSGGGYVSPTKNALTTITPVTLNNNSNRGQHMLNYAEQFVNKTQNEMRQIMQGQGYSFHTGLWCADFVSFIAGKSLGENNLPAWYKACNRAYVPAIENASRNNGALVAERKNGTIDISNVRPGNFGIINWEKDNSGVDHIGYVVKIEGNNVHTLEGNSNGRVEYKVRDISLFHSFVDIG